MSARRPSKLLEEGLTQLGLDTSIAASLEAYLDELVRWNSAYNLTAIRDRDEMIVRHLLDSLVVLPKVLGPLLDVGSGAGLPAIPLAIADRSLKVTALDSNGKKTRFMRQAKRVLALDNLAVADARAEAFGAESPFTCIISRAFASLQDFLQVTGHLLAIDGRWLAMKGKLDDAELKSVPAGIGIVEVIPLKIPGLDEARHLIVLART